MNAGYRLGTIYSKGLLLVLLRLLGCVCWNLELEEATAGWSKIHAHRAGSEPCWGQPLSGTIHSPSALTVSLHISPNSDRQELPLPRTLSLTTWIPLCWQFCILGQSEMPRNSCPPGGGPSPSE